MPHSELYDEKDGRRILNGIKDIVRNSLQTISDKYKKAAEDIPWLDELLSSLTGAAGNGSGNRTNNESDKETPEKIGAKLKSTISFKSHERNTLIYDPTGVIPGGGAKPITPGPGPTPPPKPPKPGPKPGPKPIKKTKIKSRIFKTDQKKVIENVEHIGYKMFLSSDQQLGNTDISISQKGDTGNVVCFEIGEVKDSNGNTLSFSKEYNSKGDAVAFRLRSVSIPSELIILVNEPYKSSFKIVKS
jgi:hypothetical protein